MIRFLSVLVVMMLPAQAMALSCVAPAFNADIIAQTDLIFEGKATEIIEQREDKANELSKSALFKFSIDMLWAGDLTEGDVIIERNIYWGDGFQLGESYLVVAQKQENQYVAGICGNTTPLHYAEEKLKILNDVFSKEEGH